MSEINTEYLQRCIETLQMSYDFIKNAKKGSLEYEVYKNALIQCFEVTLEQSRNLLRKKITPFFVSKKDVDRLKFKDVFRHANKYSFLTTEEVQRWLKYRDNRNNPAHDYEQIFEEKTLDLMEAFISDVQNLKEILNKDNI